MSESADPPATYTQQWLELARGDLETIDVLLAATHRVRRKHRAPCPAGHREAIKAVFAHEGLQAPRIHDLQALLERLPPESQPVDPPQAAPLTPRTVLGRYIELDSVLSATDVAELATLARRILEAAQALTSQSPRHERPDRE